MSEQVLPIPDDITTPWWEATKEGKFLLQTCLECQHVQHYPRAVCIQCAGSQLHWVESAGQGVVDSYTVVHRAPSPAFTAPYVIARVQLSEGPTMLTRIVGAEESELACDLPVTLAWDSLSDGHQLPVFQVINSKQQ